MADEDDEFAFMDVECPRCGTDLDPAPLPSGIVVLRCPRCGQVVI